MNTIDLSGNKVELSGNIDDLVQHFKYNIKHAMIKINRSLIPEEQKKQKKIQKDKIDEDLTIIDNLIGSRFNKEDKKMLPFLPFYKIIFYYNFYRHLLHKHNPHKADKFDPIVYKSIYSNKNKKKEIIKITVIEYDESESESESLQEGCTTIPRSNAIDCYYMSGFIKLALIFLKTESEKLETVIRKILSDNEFEEKYHQFIDNKYIQDLFNALGVDINIEKVRKDYEEKLKSKNQKTQTRQPQNQKTQKPERLFAKREPREQGQIESTQSNGKYGCECNCIDGTCTCICQVQGTKIDTSNARYIKIFGKKGNKYTCICDLSSCDCIKVSDTKPDIERQDGPVIERQDDIGDKGDKDIAIGGNKRSQKKKYTLRNHISKSRKHKKKTKSRPNNPKRLR